MISGYPPPDYGRIYGRGIYTYEDYSGFTVEGHDRRSYAALASYCRTEYGRPDPKRIEVQWAFFSDTCGCTPEAHALHGTEPPEGVPDQSEYTDPYEDCEFHCDPLGLPPCRDDYAWVIEPCSEPRPGALPVLSYYWS